MLQEGHPAAVKEAQQNVNWVDSLARGVNGEGLRGTYRTRPKVERPDHDDVEMTDFSFSQATVPLSGNMFSFCWRNSLSIDNTPSSMVSQVRWAYCVGGERDIERLI